MKSKPIQIGKKWLLQAETSPTAINKVIGYVTEATSAITTQFVYQPQRRHNWLSVLQVAKWLF